MACDLCKTIFTNLWISFCELCKQNIRQNLHTLYELFLLNKEFMNCFQDFKLIFFTYLPVLNSLSHKPAKSCLDYEIPGLGVQTVWHPKSWEFGILLQLFKLQNWCQKNSLESRCNMGQYVLILSSHLQMALGTSCLRMLRKRIKHRIIFTYYMTWLTLQAFSC